MLVLSERFFTAFRMTLKPIHYTHYTHYTHHTHPHYTDTIFNTRVVGEYVLFGGIGTKKKEAGRTPASATTPLIFF